MSVSHPHHRYCWRELYRLMVSISISQDSEADHGSDFRVQVRIIHSQTELKTKIRDVPSKPLPHS